MIANGVQQVQPVQAVVDQSARRALEVAARRDPEHLASPGFGRCFSDHMVTMRWTRQRGWHDGAVAPYGPLQLDPATVGLHYGQVIFEGMKAYRQANGSVALFRPTENARRLNRSARRMAMPEIPEDLFLQAVELLVSTDQDWVPNGRGQSLYIRPLMIATEPALVMRPAEEFLLLLFAFAADPVVPLTGPPMSVWISEDYIRAAPGGTGGAKCAGNYAAGLLAQSEAAEHGCHQVVWLDAVERRWVEELGVMNLFFVWRGDQGAPPRVVTPEAKGTILPGVVRSSLLTLARSAGYQVAEERVDIEEWKDGCADGRLLEVFACGTAAVVAPIGTVRRGAETWRVGDGNGGPVASQLRRELLDIQHGVAPDRFDWMVPVAGRRA